MLGLWTVEIGWGVLGPLRWGAVGLLLLLKWGGKWTVEMGGGGVRAVEVRKFEAFEMGGGGDS